MFKLSLNAQNSASRSTQMEVDVIPSLENVDFHKDYAFTSLDCFGVDDDNRPCDESDITVKKYAKIMQKGKWFYELSPLYVGIHSLNIFNGEHRRKAINLAKQKGANPIIYVRFFDDSENKPEKREALNSGRHWNSDDHVDALVSAGNKNFIFLRNFCLNEDHPQLHSSKGKPYYNKGAIVLGSTYKEFKEAYLSGEWDLKPEDINTAEKRYSELIRIKKSLGYDDAGQDCWIYIGMAWYRFSNNKNFADRIKRLPDGIETFYSALRYVNNTNSNKSEEWYGRFIEALEKAERHSKRD